jgi:hypothetical protein
VEREEERRERGVKRGKKRRGNESVEREGKEG